MPRTKRAPPAPPPKPTATIKDRIVELRRVRASDLKDHPLNWRTHPQEQLDALRALFREIGFSGAELAFPADGRGKDGNFDELMLIDGHARKKLLGNEVIPVLVTDLTADEAFKVLATFDPVAAMAEADADQLKTLLGEIETSSQELEAMLAALAEQNGILGDPDQPTELVQVNIQPPPVMSWCLIGIPTVRYGEIAADMERIGQLNDVICETTSNNG